MFCHPDWRQPQGLCSSVMTCANGFMLLHVEDRWRHYILKATHKHHICIPRSAETSFCYLKMPHTQTHLYFSDLLYSFLSSHIFLFFFSLLHHLLTNGSSAVNGCRQNESSTAKQKQHNNPHASSQLTFLTSNHCFQLKCKTFFHNIGSSGGKKSESGEKYVSLLYLLQTGTGVRRITVFFLSAV